MARAPRARAPPRAGRLRSRSRRRRSPRSLPPGRRVASCRRNRRRQGVKKFRETASSEDSRETLKGLSGRVLKCRAPVTPVNPRVGHESVTECPDRKSTRLNSSHGYISYAVFCLKKKKTI